jgi:predicted secreted hydrolase
MNIPHCKLKNKNFKMKKIEAFKLDGFVRSRLSRASRKPGSANILKRLDSHFHGNDGRIDRRTSYENKPYFHATWCPHVGMRVFYESIKFSYNAFLRMHWVLRILNVAFCNLHFALLAFFILQNLFFFSPAWPADEWRQVSAPRIWNFPRDHGSHPEYRTEWWYFTGILLDNTGSQYGYQLTFFRQGIRYKLPNPSGPWDIRDVYLGHFTLTDVPQKKFQYSERISRSGPGLAGARTEAMDVWLFDWSARMKETTIALKARHDQMELDLTLVPKKPLIFHGQNGVSRKGPGEGQASYYTSFTHLETKGFLKTSSHIPTEVKGRSWFDQEFGSNQLTAEQKGWDWFSLYLSDGRDLMIYFLRLKDGSIEPASSGTLVEADGKTRHLKLSEISIKILDRWKSPRSGAEYPCRWRIQIPSSAVDLTVAPYVPNQELVTKGSTGITYWEGAISGQGTSKGQPVNCQGYIELTGYAGSLGGIF